MQITNAMKELHLYKEKEINNIKDTMYRILWDSHHPSKLTKKRIKDIWNRTDSL